MTFLVGGFSAGGFGAAFFGSIFFGAGSGLVITFSTISTVFFVCYWSFKCDVMHSPERVVLDRFKANTMFLRKEHLTHANQVIPCQGFDNRFDP